MYKSTRYRQKAAAVLPAGPSFKTHFISGAGVTTGVGTAVGLLIMAALITGASVHGAWNYFTEAGKDAPAQPVPVKAQYKGPSQQSAKADEEQGQGL